MKNSTKLEIIIFGILGIGSIVAANYIARENSAFAQTYCCGIPLSLPLIYYGIKNIKQ